MAGAKGSGKESLCYLWMVIWWYLLNDNQNFYKKNFFNSFQVSNDVTKKSFEENSLGLIVVAQKCLCLIDLTKCTLNC